MCFDKERDDFFMKSKKTENAEVKENGLPNENPLSGYISDYIGRSY